MSAEERPAESAAAASAGVRLRPMRAQDAAAADEVMQTALTDGARSRGEQQRPPEPGRRERALAVLRHFVATDPEGCWVAERDEQMLGMAVAIRRGRLWGLGLLFIAPQAQRMGIGRMLLDATARHAAGASVKMIMASTDPRAVRTYAAHGLDVHPAMTATGRVERSRLQAQAAGRAGSLADLPLVEEVDMAVRGSSRAVDVEFLLGEGAAITVVDDASGRGYAVHEPGLPIVGGHPMMLSATSEEAAAKLLREVLAQAEEEPVEIFGLTRRQNWAIQVAFEARLSVAPGSPLCLTPGLEPPGPWLLSGIYF